MEGSFTPLRWDTVEDRTLHQERIPNMSARWVEQYEGRPGHFEVFNLTLVQLRTSSAAMTQSSPIPKLAEDVHALAAFFANGSLVAEDSTPQGPTKWTIYLGGDHVLHHSRTYDGLPLWWAKVVMAPANPLSFTSASTPASEVLSVIPAADHPGISQPIPILVAPPFNPLTCLGGRSIP